jgi:shikimate kinase
MSRDYGNSYYEYDSLLRLERHLAICSPFASDARAVGHRIASLSGVAFFDLERLIEHRSGASIEAIRSFDGQEAFEQLQAEALDRLLRDRPFGVLVLAGEALMNAFARRRLLAETDLVSIEMDFESYRLRCSRESGASFDEGLDADGLALAKWQALTRAASPAPYRIAQSADVAAMSAGLVATVPALRPS